MSGSLAQDLSSNEVSRELEILYTCLQELHPGLTIYRSDKDIESKYESLKARISQHENIRRSECLLLYRELCNYINCGHTVVYNPRRMDHNVNVGREIPEKLIDNEIKKDSICRLILPTFYTISLAKNKIHYKKYLRSFFREVQDKNCNEIVIDIRGNRGGSVHMAAYLASFIIDSSFTFFKSVELTNIKHVTYDHYIEKDAFFRFRTLLSRREGNKRYYQLHRELKPRRPNSLSPHLGVRIKILTDNKTFSAASMFASVCRTKSDAVIIGEKDAVALEGSGLNPVKLILPYSSFIVEIPIAYIYLNL